MVACYTIVSRDKHLRNLKDFHRIPILNATNALHSIEQQTHYNSYTARQNLSRA